MKKITHKQSMGSEHYQISMEKRKIAVKKALQEKKAQNQPRPGYFHARKNYCWLTGQTKITT